MSALLEDTITLRFGNLKPILQKGFGYCYQCKHQIKLNDTIVTVTNMGPDKTIKKPITLILSACNKCFDKLPASKDKKIRQVRGEDLYNLLQDLKKDTELQKHFTVTEKGIMVIPTDKIPKLTEDYEEDYV